MSTNRGFKIFDIRNYMEITENNPYKDYLGNLYIAVPLYRSKLIFLTGSENNQRFKPNELILWNDERNAIIGRIKLHKDHTILDVFLTWNVAFVKLNEKILIFEISNLTLIGVIEDIFNHNLISASCLYNPAIISYVSNLNPSYLKIEKFISQKNIFSIDICKNQMNLITGFREIDFIKISDFGDYICVVGEGANRIHLYSLFDYQLKYCLWRGSKISKTIDVCFDLKCKFMSIITDSRTLHIFKLYENQNKAVTNKINKKMVENANNLRISNFHDLHFGNYKQSFTKKIKVKNIIILKSINLFIICFIKNNSF